MGKEQWGKRIGIGVAVMLLAMVAVTDVLTVRRILSHDTDSFVMQTWEDYEAGIDSLSAETCFCAIGSHMQKITIPLLYSSEDLTAEEKRQILSEIRGSVVYSVTDTTGRVIVPETEASAEEVFADTEDALTLVGIASGAFEAGETYLLYLDFSFEYTKGSGEDFPLAIGMDANGAMIVQYAKVTYHGLQIAILIALHLFVAGILWWIFKKGINGANFFVICMGLGCFLALVNVPFSRDDEFRHFVRAYDLSCGGAPGHYARDGEVIIGNIQKDIVGAYVCTLPSEISEMRLLSYEGNITNASYYAEINTDYCRSRMLSLLSRETTEEVVTVSECVTWYHGWETYFASAIGIWAGRMLGMRPLFLYYAAAFGQILIASLLFLAAFWLTKQYRLIPMICGLTVPVLWHVGSAHPDGILMALTVLCMAVILHIKENKIKILSTNGILWMLVWLLLVIWLYKIKLPYALLGLSCLFLLTKENGTLPVKKRVLLFGGCAAAVLVGCILFRHALMEYVYGFLPRDYVTYIGEHIVAVGILFLRTGRDLLLATWQRLQITRWLPYGWAAAILLVLSKKKDPWVRRVAMLVLFLCMLLVIVVVGYTLMPPDYGVIWGLTYRYMLPFLPLVYVVLPQGNDTTDAAVRKLAPFVLIVMSFSGIVISI